MQSQLELQRGGIASPELVLWSSDVLDGPNPLGCRGDFPSLSLLSVIEFPTAALSDRSERRHHHPCAQTSQANKQTTDNGDPPPTGCRYEILLCLSLPYKRPDIFWVTALLQCSFVSAGFDLDP
jgi:hypothetical protein